MDMLFEDDKVLVGEVRVETRNNENLDICRLETSLGWKPQILSCVITEIQLAETDQTQLAKGVFKYSYCDALQKQQLSLLFALSPIFSPI